MVPLFVKLALRINSFVQAGQIIGVKIHTYRFDGESEQCSYLKQQPRSRGLSVHSQIYNHFNHERHLQNRQTYKQKRTTALKEWYQICAS